MAKSTSASVSTPVSTPAPAATSAAPSTAAKVVRRVTKKPEAEATPAASAPVVEQATPAAAPVVEASSEATTPAVVEEDKVVSTLNGVLQALTVQSESLKTLRSQVVAALKQHKQDLAALQKTVDKAQKRRSANPKRKPSGFAVPTFLSKELSSFLNIAEGTMMPRPQVTRMIYTYVRDHKLQDEKDKRLINVNQELSGLFNRPVGSQVSCLKLQNVIKHHFTKTA